MVKKINFKSFHSIKKSELFRFVWFSYELIISFFLFIVFKPLLIISKINNKLYEIFSFLIIRMTNYLFIANMINQKILNHLKYDIREYRDIYDKNLKLYLKVCDPSVSFKNKRILDFGCGFGGKDLLIYEKFSPKEILAIDLSKRNIQYANEILPKNQNVLRFETKDIFKLKLKNHFETIISFTVFEHLDKKEIIKIMDKFVDLLKSDGEVIIVFNHYNDRFGSHVKEYIFHPWPQSLFEEDILFKYWNNSFSKDLNITERSYFNSKYVHGIDESNDDHYMNLNKISKQQFLRMIKKSKLRLTKIYEYSKLPHLKLIPILPKKYLEGSVVYCLRK